MANSKYIGYKVDTRTGQATVVDYLGGGIYLVSFENGFVKKAQLTDIKKGHVWNPYAKSVFGVGYIGEGVYKVNTPEYIAWQGMMSRCYSSYTQKNQPTYIGCFVADEWHNYQNFAKWYTSHKNYGKGYKLDKDFRLLGNKMYSPNTCDLIPNALNVLLSAARSKRGNYPIGVTFRKSRGVYEAQCHLGGLTENGSTKQTYLGAFTTPEEAFKAYKTAKEAHVKKVAEFYKSEICEEIYNNLINWEVKIDD